MSEELDATCQLIEEEKKQTTTLTEKLVEYKGHSEPGDVERLKADLKAAKEKAKHMWQLSCSHSREQAEQIAALEAEVARLKTSRSPEALSDVSPSVPLSGRSSPVSQEVDTELTRPTCKGKAPPVDSFTGEDPAVKLEDWLPILESVTMEWLVARREVDREVAHYRSGIY